MSQETSLGQSRYLDGGPDLVFAHVSDLHGQLTQRHQIYHDNSSSMPNFDFGNDDRVIESRPTPPVVE